jgi:NAD(P)-dependent dehydrogenase (short-subunit alcohol dehydrogenase family)
MVGSKDLQPSNSRFFPNVFFHNQFRAEPEWPSQTTNLSEKVAIITGGNAGLGLEAASQLLSFKLSHLILAVRSSEKGEAAAKQLQSQYPKAKIEVWPLDMSLYDSVQAFARRVETDLSRLDMVVLNAGVRKLSFDPVRSTGHEENIQINYLSTVLLALLLLPILKSKSPPGTAGRLAIVNSGLALAAKFSNRDEVPLLPSFDDPKHFDSVDRYNSSKALAHMFLWKLVDYVSADDVIVNLPDPGFVKGTDLSRDARGGLKVATAIFAAITARNKKNGASTYLDALLNKGKESHGCFMMSWQIHP